MQLGPKPAAAGITRLALVLSLLSVVLASAGALPKMQTPPAAVGEKHTSHQVHMKEVVPKFENYTALILTFTIWKSCKKCSQAGQAGLSSGNHDLTKRIWWWLTGLTDQFWTERSIECHLPIRRPPIAIDRWDLCQFEMCQLLFLPIRHLPIKTFANQIVSQSFANQTFANFWRAQDMRHLPIQFVSSANFDTCQSVGSQ